MRRTDPRYYSAELHRLDGELLGVSGAKADAQEACFHQALRVAREQGAKSLELRAAMSLGRLWHSQRKTAQARKLLERVYVSFGKECVTADLKEARALLDEWK
jgi:adenylate cyclase